MKNGLLILLCLPMIGFGQNVNIPDANFKAYLVGDNYINTNGDSEIQVSEATAFNGTITCDFMNISDLTGIEAFTALTSLYCGYNQLTSLDVSNNLALTKLWCNGNQLTSLDVSSNLALTSLYCWENQFTSLDVSNNLALTTLLCFYNFLTSLDLSNNTALELLNCETNQLTSLDLRSGNNVNLDSLNCRNNSNLYCIDVDNPSWSNTNWTSIDFWSSFSNNCSTAAIQEQTTNKELLKVTDLLGRETKGTKNEVLFYIYDDGTVEKRKVIE